MRDRRWTGPSTKLPEVDFELETTKNFFARAHAWHSSVMADQTIEIRRLSECPIEQAVEIWNAGFKGYRVDMTKSLDAYVTRLRQEDLSLEVSLIAFRAGRLAGFLLNGIRKNAGRKEAWNGGTGVSPEFRGQGIGTVLVDASIKLYLEERVELATLEALSDNETAIDLYQKFGYEIVDQLAILHRDGVLSSRLSDGRQTYSIKRVPPQALAGLDFYDASAPWQTQWQTLVLKNGEALIAEDDQGQAVGYALSSKTFGDDGSLKSIALYQCGAAARENDAESIAANLLDEVFGPLDVDCRRVTYNLSKRNQPVQHLLAGAGFETLLEQVQMARTLSARAN